jgi:acyl-CoA dehydrogenase
VFRDRLRQMLDRVAAFADRVAAEAALEGHARQAASALYHITSAILMTSEAARPGADARRVLYARLVLEHRLSVQDPLAPNEAAWEREAAEVLLAERCVTVEEVSALLI